MVVPSVVSVRCGTLSVVPAVGNACGEIVEGLGPWEITDNIAQGLLCCHRAPCARVISAADGTHVEVVGGVGCEVVNDNERLACGGSGCLIDK